MLYYFLTAVGAGMVAKTNFQVQPILPFMFCRQKYIYLMTNSKILSVEAIFQWVSQL